MRRSIRKWMSATITCSAAWCGAVGAVQALELSMNWTNRGTAGFSAAEKAVIDASLNLWTALLPTPEPRSVSLTISRAALGNALGSTSGFHFDPLGNPTAAAITIDSGTSFFIDPNPLDNSEYSPSGHPSHFNAIGGGAVGAWDLFSVAVHEVGHAVGFGDVFDRFDSRVTSQPGQSSLVYHGQDFVATLANGGHLADDYDLMGLPGFQISERALPSALDLAILNDAFDYEDTSIYRLSGGPRALPDHATTTVPLIIDDDIIIDDLDVALSIRHTFDADLDVYLTSPGGTRVELTSDNGLSSNDYGLSSLWTRFDDESVAFHVVSGTGPFQGTYAPEHPLSPFDGETTKGTWKLEIVDDDFGDVGTLDNMALIVTTPPTLTWDGDGPGNWTDHRWGDRAPFPTAQHFAVIVNDAVNVTDSQAARRVVVESGDLRMGDTGQLATPLARIGVDGTLSGTGTLLGDVVSDGRVAPGASIGKLNIVGNYTQSADGMLEIEIGGIGNGAISDRLAIQGSSVLDGTIAVILASPSRPSAAATFDILTATGGISGNFASEVLPVLGGGLYFDLSYASNAVTLCVAGVLGDYNLDGIVEAADYTVWRHTLGSTTLLAADGNGNGIVDADDYGVWTANFGSTYVAPLTSRFYVTSIPEPNTPMLTLIVSGVSCCVSRRSQSAASRRRNEAAVTKRLENP